MRVRWEWVLGCCDWVQGGPFWHREHSTRIGAEERSVGSCNGGSRGVLGVALAPYLQVGVFPAATCATQGFGVAHDSGVIACEHPMVASGTAVAAAIGDSGRVQRDVRAQLIQSGGRGFLADRNKMWKWQHSCWVKLVTGRDVLAPYGTSHTVAAELRQRSRSHFLIPARSAIGQPMVFGWRSIDAFASHIIY